MIFARGALEIIKDNWLIGLGFRGEEMRAYFYRYSGLSRQSHSTPLDVLLQTGVIGGVFFFLSLYYAFASLKKSSSIFKKMNDDESRWVVLVIAISLASLIVSSVFLHMVQSKLWYVLLGLAQATADSAIRSQMAFVKIENEVDKSDR